MRPADDVPQSHDVTTGNRSFSKQKVIYFLSGSKMGLECVGAAAAMSVDHILTEKRGDVRWGN